MQGVCIIFIVCVSFINILFINKRTLYHKMLLSLLIELQMSALYFPRRRIFRSNIYKKIDDIISRLVKLSRIFRSSRYFWRSICQCTYTFIMCNILF